MEEHITFEEMQRFVFPNDLSIDTITLGSRINAHILTCKECAAQYEALLELRRESEELNRKRIDAQIAAEIETSKKAERDLIEDQLSGIEPSDSQLTALSPDKRREQGISN